jgi:hypothetical protein
MLALLHCISSNRIPCNRAGVFCSAVMVETLRKETKRVAKSQMDRLEAIGGYQKQADTAAAMHKGHRSRMLHIPCQIFNHACAYVMRATTQVLSTTSACKRFSASSQGQCSSVHSTTPIQLRCNSTPF